MLDLCFLVDIRWVHQERAHLHRGHLETARAPEVHFLKRPSADACALRHAMDLIDGQAQRTKILECVHTKGCSASETEDALIQAQILFDFTQNRHRSAMTKRFPARLTVLCISGCRQRGVLS